MFKKKAELVNVDQGLAQPSIETEDFAARFDEEGNWIVRLIPRRGLLAPLPRVCLTNDISD